MPGKNCWEVMNCGRELGGVKTRELGVCPAATAVNVNGSHGGKNGGRVCWVVAGTLCGGKKQGTFAEKQVTCMACDFFKKVRSEEGATFRMAAPAPKAAVRA